MRNGAMSWRLPLSDSVVLISRAGATPSGDHMRSVLCWSGFGPGILAACQLSSNDASSQRARSKAGTGTGRKRWVKSGNSVAAASGDRKSVSRMARVAVSCRCSFGSRAGLGSVERASFSA